MRGGFGGYGFGPGARLHELIGNLNLTDAQKESVKTILRESHARLEPGLKEARAAKRTLFEAAFAATPDENAVRQASESVAQAMSNQTLEMAHTMAAIRATLTPEQRQQLDETLAKHREHREKRGEQFRERRGDRFEEFLQSF
jgi:Spy/CpxP family protein refolding chaperone